MTPSWSDSWIYPVLTYEFAPKYRKTEGGEGKEEKNEDDDAARKVNATMVAEVEASLHKLDSKGDD